MGRYVFMKKKLLNITCFIIFPLSLFSQQQNDVEQAQQSSGNYATQSNDQNNPFVIHEVIQNKQQDGKTEQISPIAQQQKMSVASGNGSSLSSAMKWNVRSVKFVPFYHP